MLNTWACKVSFLEARERLGTCKVIGSKGVLTSKPFSEKIHYPGGRQEIGHVGDTRFLQDLFASNPIV
ncbi:predicted protein [Botrytis cinerea T4]|uniref:Uncharacterized protein n=1 Tax=Botryotinia fuckeliana (strain T4) TaxID=999810 RepID=G2YBM9_BOTF4|nr:predicted protein [Botrytis cinerea T4]